MISKVPIMPDRIRRISGSFSWIDHRLIADGILASMSTNEIALYFFLVLVGDKNGVSFYGYDRICKLLDLDVDAYSRARDNLIAKGLIAFDRRVYQVLSLPVRPKQTVQRPRPRNAEAQSVAEIFARLAQMKQ